MADVNPGNTVPNAHAARGMDTAGARFALVMGHVAGMIDLAALPVWVGTLIAGFGFTPVQAGATTTLFLVGIVIASLLMSRRFARLSNRLLVPLSYGTAGLVFLALTRVSGFPAFAVLHLVAGLALGCGISITHGTMGRTSNPHRVWAIASFGFGVFAVIFLGTAPGLIARHGPAMLFLLLGGIQLVAAFVTFAFFPRLSPAQESAPRDRRGLKGMDFGKAVWCVIFGVMLMNLVQAMTFSFVERIGMDRGFGADRVALVLMLLGFVNLTPALLAGAFEKRLPPLKVGIAGAIMQAILAFFLTWASDFAAYAGPCLLFSFVMIFTHTFLFGHLSRVEPTGRAVAATPAMTMSGSAVAPLLGGFLVQAIGYQAIGIAALLIACVTVALFATAARHGSRRGAAAPHPSDPR